MTATKNNKTGIRIRSIEDWAEKVAVKKTKKHVIQDLLPAKKGEYMAIAGRTGIGKTNLTLHLAFCLSTGTPFYGLKCWRSKVAFLEFEGDDSNIMDRYNKIKNYFPSTEKRLKFGMIPLSNPKDMFEDILTQTEGCPMLIIDPVKFLIPGDYLKPKDASSFIRRFKEMLSSNKKVAIISLPIRKPNEKSLIQPGDVYSMKGATEYADSATSVLLLEKKSYSRENSDQVTLHFAKSRIASQHLETLDLNFNRKKCLFESKNDIVIETAEE
ncbi:AAA family ATPase [Chloroflexota bacterium]